MTLEGRTALSVEISTNRLTPTAADASITLSVPNTLVRAASTGWSSSTGTCLWAAAWSTTSGRYRSKTSKSASRSLMSTRACWQGPSSDGRGVVEVGLVVVEEDEQGGIEPGDLAADLRTDGTSGPGDQHPVALERPADRVEVGGDRGAAQEVLDARLAGPADGEHVGRPVDHVAARSGSTFMVMPAASAACSTSAIISGEASGMASSTCWSV